MITILHGPEASLWQRCSEFQGSSEAILLPPTQMEEGLVFSGHNANLRDLLAKLRPLVGGTKFDQIVLRHKTAASFLLDRLLDHLSPEEQVEASKMATSLDSQTSHNWFTSSFLADAWARLFADLVSGLDIVWIIPDVHDMGPGFIEMVRRLLINHRPQKLRLVMGFKSDRRPSAPDGDGILWNYLQIRNLRDSFSVFEDATVFEVPVVEASSTGCVRQPLQADLWDSGRDREVFDILASETCSSEVLQEGCDILVRAFGSYDFRAALQFGLQMLRHEGGMSTQQRALVHAAVGISAHNRQFSASKGNERFNSFLERHFGNALEFETDVIRRSVVSYRLATTLARRRKEAEAAVSCVNRSLADLHSELAPSRRRAYYEAWLLNIRAYAHMLLRDYRQSAADVEKSFGLAEEFWNNSDDPSPDEIYSAQLFAGNRATLAMYGHDDEGLDIWFSKGTNLFEKHWSVGKRYVRYLRMVIAKRKLALGTAVVAAQEGLDDSIAERSAEYQDLYRMNLADLHYRLGDLDQVFALLGDAIQMYRKLAEERRGFVARMFLAQAEARANNIKAADGLYRQALKSRSDLGVGVLADLISARGMLAARQQLAAEAESLMDEAIGLAVESREQSTLLLVARRTGDALLEFGDREQAVDAYRRALEIASVVPPEGSHDPHPSDLARIRIGLYECEGLPEHLEHALRGLPVALELDSDFWWELPRILRDLLNNEDSLGLIEKNRPEVELLLRAVEQRRDTQELAARLVERLETPAIPPEVQIGVGAIEPAALRTAGRAN